MERKPVYYVRHFKGEIATDEELDKLERANEWLEFGDPAYGVIRDLIQQVRLLKSKLDSISRGDE